MQVHLRIYTMRTFKNSLKIAHKFLGKYNLNEFSNARSNFTLDVQSKDTPDI